MTSEPAIQLSGVGKRYWQVNERAMLLKSLMPFRRVDRRELWAVRDVDLRIDPGETVGILGRNGAGKTTLLRMLAGVSQPSTGQIRIQGRVAPLIGVGVGFHQEMSGRENVYVNGMLLGLTRAEVDARFDAILDFAELEGFIDTPVKFYSSGMFMRLGFAVAVHVRPSVLLVDEVLAVGDIAFQLKCFERMRALKSEGATVLIVSHSMHAIRLLCPRVLLFRHGALELDSEAEAVIARHHELLSIEGHEAGSGGGVTVLERALLDPSGQQVHHGEQRTPLDYRLRLRFERPVDSPQLLFYVVAQDGTLAYEMKTEIGRSHRRFGPGDEIDASIKFEPRLGGGTYRLLVSIADLHGRDFLLRESEGTLLYLAPPLGTAGVADLGASIELDGTEMTDHASLLLDARAPDEA
ncbi:MAG: ABC transporter ATP-binding protein [Actinomycetota bacterium]|nr:ABC transporter ATP-binding protein [Acidimicrobiia bacterium]MDQ3292946.1 ABC transporter ATP-binding protein [Actinomycetota bacterium]